MPAKSKRRVRRLVLRVGVARLLLVLVLAGIAGAAGPAGAPLVALLAGFAAAALAIDRVSPFTGFLRMDSKHAFAQLAWQRRRQSLGRRAGAHGDRDRLELLSAELERASARRHLGIEAIRLDSIIGTVEPEKASAFDGAFRPPKWSRGRWESMWVAWRRGDSFPPISVYRLGTRHFVIDGHHRVSVARSLEATTIDADLIELLSGLELAQSTLPERKSGRHTWTSRPLLPVLAALAAGLALTLLSGALGAAPGYVLILAACVFIGRGLGRPTQTGLREHRQ